MVLTPPWSRSSTASLHRIPRDCMLFTPSRERPYRFLSRHGSVFSSRCHRRCNLGLLVLYQNWDTLFGWNVAEKTGIGSRNVARFVAHVCHIHGIDHFRQPTNPRKRAWLGDMVDPPSLHKYDIFI